MAPLQLGSLRVPTPVVLAPMAGVTNRAFRRLCREAALETGHPIGLFVAEMVTARALVERNATAVRIVSFGADEYPRSAQVYGVEPAMVGEAVRLLCDRNLADHIDLNFGCPVPKVTRKGGGGALPWKSSLFAAIVRAAVRAAETYQVPVTIKMRKGIDADHLTYLTAGPIAEAEGAAGVALHARTVAEHYSGHADWAAIADLKRRLAIPVLGNGDIWSGADALAMLEQTNCDGLVIGRGALGRPWLFADLAWALHGEPMRTQPTLAEVARTIYRHAQLLVEEFADEQKGCRDLRKHIAWYLKGYPVGGERRRALALTSTLADLHAQLTALGDAPYPGADAEGPRGRAGSPKTPHLPHNWLTSRELDPSWAPRLTEDVADTAGG